MNIGVSTEQDEPVRVGKSEIFPHFRLLLRDGKKIEIGSKAFDILLELIAAKGDAVSKDALLTRAWPNQIVEENNLQAHISAIRRALASDRDLLTTEFGRGYRLKCSSSGTEVDEAQRNYFFDVPASMSPIIGRDEQLEELCVAISRGNVVTVTGTGGIGKTKIAIELGHRLKSFYRNGVCFVELSPLGQPELVMPTIARKLSIDTGPDGFASDARSKLQRHEILLILDSCEHLLSGVADTVRVLLGAVPGLAILTTSQEPLAIEGEQVFRLQPLRIPSGEIAKLGEARCFASVELFVQRVREAERNYGLEDAHTPDICRICRQLDGIPLALELAAARVPLIGLSAVLNGLSNRFRLLTAGRRTAVPRHQTLRATLEWSYGLLNSAEQRLLQRLGLFAGSFTLSAVNAVAVHGTDDSWEVTNLLASLVSKSLVAIEPKANTTRFHLFESMRALALEKLITADEFDETAGRHASYYRTRLASAAADWRALSSGQWLDEYRDDLADVRAALEWTFSEEKDSRSGAKLLCSTLPFWLQLSLLDECRVRAEFALSRLKEDEKLDPVIEVQLQRALGASLGWVRGPTPEAGKAWQRTLDLACSLDDLEHQLQAHYGLWLYALRAGEYRNSLEHAESLISLSSRGGDGQAIHTGERTKGVSLNFLGRNCEGIGIIEQMLAEQRFESNQSFPLRFGVDQRIAGLSFLARSHWLNGSREVAKEMAEQAVSEATQLNHATTLCCALLEGACTVAAFAQDSETLYEHASAAVAVAERYNLGFWRAYSSAFQALSFAWTQPLSGGIERLRIAVETLRRLGLHRGYSVFESGLAELLARYGQAGEAKELVDILLSSIDATEHWGTQEFSRVRKLVASPVR
jgi:predicted ATPase/DNA-binding winged helix-turn-helix (wHTH) protein